MEVKLKDLILTVDSFLSPEQVGAIIRTYKKRKFFPSRVVGNGGEEYVDATTRNVTELSIVRNEKSMTDTHWCNFLLHRITKLAQTYCEMHGVGSKPQRIETINVLRYEKGGYYRRHVDSGPEVPRTLSLIVFLNNDYKGGGLEFSFHNQSLKIEPGAGKAIIWPSNFLFPHTALEVEEGTRYALVSWLR